MKALLSVSDKTGIADFARRLAGAGWELISTGGTHRALHDAAIPVRQVSDLTAFPEILDGRVKTLHPAIHGGILARRDTPSQMTELAQRAIAPIDAVIVNLYPFAAAIARPGATLDDALENIDIGGPTLLRAAAKNFPAVAVIAEPADYGWVADALADGPAGLTPAQRRHLATKAFRHVAAYDAIVADYLACDTPDETDAAPDDDAGAPAMPPRVTISLTRAAGLRYGENPHQRAALYVPAGGDGSSSGGVARARQHHGPPLSFNNLLDADAAWRTLSDCPDPAACIIKHANPCGLASRPDLAEAYRLAHAGDPVSAFGGIVGFNRPVTAAAAAAMAPVFYEVIIAPAYDADALPILRRKRSLRILEAAPETAPAVSATDAAGYDLRPLTGGILIQTPDHITENPQSWTTATERAPTAAELDDLAFAWMAVKHLKSNAIAFVKDRALVGMGAGQPNRVVSVHLSQRAAGANAAGCVLASDAFFPFPDNIELAAAAGITAIIQPGGSIRDDQVIAAANAANIAMLFTGIRHFRH